jgi:hypothetical protein
MGIQVFHHIVYEVTNLINGKRYIGKHSTKNLNDGYLGSGIGIRKAIKKYGKENFEKKILAEFDTEEDALKYEREIVSDSVVKDSNTYNMVNGGKGWNTEEAKRMNKKWCDNPSSKKICGEVLKQLWKDPKFREKQSKIISLRNVKKWKEDKEYRKTMFEMNSIKSKKLWRDVEFREKICSINRNRLVELWKNKEYREKMSEMSRGHNNPSAKLKPEDVKQIKQLLKNDYTLIKIAKIFNVGTSTVSRIKNEKSWKHIKI